MIFHVYDDPKPEGYFVNEPVGMFRTILDADWLLYLLLPMLLVGIIALLMFAWRIHEIPAHKAQHKNMRQIELVTVLTLFGLIEHWVWAVALFVAYMDWQVLEDALVRILRRAKMDDESAPLSALSTAQSAPVVATVPATAPISASTLAATDRQEPTA
jgi:hypothetical protein